MASRQATTRARATSAASPKEKYDVARLITQFLGTAICIAALGLPIWAISRVAVPFAGKTSSVSAVINVTIAITAALSVTLAGLSIWTIHQRRELRRLRQRCQELEGKLRRTRKR